MTPHDEHKLYLRDRRAWAQYVAPKRTHCRAHGVAGMSVFILREHNARDRMKAVWDFACQILQHPGKAAKVKIEECQPTRTLDQNDMFHAICGDIAKQKTWAGHKLDTEAWKRLLVDAWARAEGKQQGRIVPSLDGQSIVNLGIQTRSMKVGDMADLITFAQAWCVENDVALNDQERGAA
mgnify:CR=1 FL=1